MTKLADGSTVSIHRDGPLYTVEHRTASGLLLNSLTDCTLEEARAGLDTDPARW